VGPTEGTNDGEAQRLAKDDANGGSGGLVDGLAEGDDDAELPGLAEDDA
jgi:hypothetical protein